jgi:hypothetical protein
VLSAALAKMRARLRAASASRPEAAAVHRQASVRQTRALISLCRRPDAHVENDRFVRRGAATVDVQIGNREELL